MEVRHMLRPFTTLEVLSPNNNDDKLLKLQSKFNFEAFTFSATKNRLLSLISYGHSTL